MIKKVPQKTEKMVISFRDAGGTMTNGAESRTSERSNSDQGNLCHLLTNVLGMNQYLHLELWTEKQSVWDLKSSLETSLEKDNFELRTV